MKSVRCGTIGLLTVVLAVLSVMIWRQMSLRPPVPAPRGAANWEVYFSPEGGCTEAIVRALDGARSSVLVQAYSFTSAPIARALLNAKKRGLDVQAILDNSAHNDKYSEADFLAHANIPTYIDAAHAIAHNKVMIIDGAVVITGSFNFTRAAEERNAENLLILHDPALAAAYTANWRKHLAHSERYAGR